MKRALMGLLALAVGATIWLPVVHLFFVPREGEFYREDGVSPRARELAAWHLNLWTNPDRRAQEIARMRGSNAEWDFMGRTFLVLAFANLSLREPAAAEQYLTVMDTIIDETLRLERERGMFFFLMDYARHGEFVNKPARSLFLDGEIALMLAARRMVAEKEEYGLLLRERVEQIVSSMQRGPVLCAESYPDECWMFCNSVALAAVRLADALDGSDHREFFKVWLQTARQKLTHPATGLLYSSFTVAGEPVDGPEGSSIWTVAHCLQVVDAAFARDQYDRARRELGVNLLGFGYAREWPRSWQGPMDVDSGPIVPVLQASAGSSGQAVLGAAAFGDRAFLRTLCASLSFAGFPVRRDGQLRYAASNQVGDAVLLYALVQGPLWAKAGAR